MATIAPFSAIRFDHTRWGGDLSKQIAPPYDVLDPSDKDALLTKSDRNIVAIDLPHIPPKSLGPIEVYEKSAKILEDWLTDGTLIREETPALYLYHQTFEHDGKTYTRKKYIARIRLQPFSDGVILPHEKTFGGAKEDRLALMKTTRANISAVFGLYTDPENRIGKAFETTVAKAPDVSAELDGVKNGMWIITDPGVIDSVVSAMADKRVYIADGHHRYGTALNYREFVKEQNSGNLPEDHPANFAMMVLGSMDDPGSLIIAYNRALAGVNLATVLKAWRAGVEKCDANHADIHLVDGASGEDAYLRFSDRTKLKTLEPDQVEPWYDLDAAYLHRYLIDELLKSELGTDPKVRYVKSVENARQTAKDEGGVALLVNPTPMAHLRAVSEAGGLMPQKSTYFFPKLATGLTINPLA